MIIDDEKGIPSTICKYNSEVTFTNVTIEDALFGNNLSLEDDAPSGKNFGSEDDAPSDGTSQNQEKIEALKSTDIITL